MEKINGRLQLKNVTLVAMTSVRIEETIDALLYSMREIDYADVILITHKKPKNLPDSIRYEHIEKLKNINAFNYDCVYRLGDYIHTDFALLVHSDGFVVNPDSWRDEFLDYDYIGSPWPRNRGECDKSLRTPDGEECRVGNSVGIRSKRLLDYPKKYNMPWIPDLDGTYNEDTFICCRNKRVFEAAGMKIAPLEVAMYFGREKEIEEAEGKDLKPFIFHKWWGINEQYPNFNRPVKVDPFHKAWRWFRKVTKLDQKDKGEQ